MQIFFAEDIYFQYNKGIYLSKFAHSFKFANIADAFKQDSRN